MKRYIRIWWIFTTRATQIMLASRLGAIVFTFGKILRFGLYIFFLVILVKEAKMIAGYSLWQVILFFATFNFIDASAQFFLRDVYRFRQHVKTGYFDNYLVKPFSPLFKALFGGSDILDLIILFLSAGFIGVAMQHVVVNIQGILLYILLVINALFIALSFHIFVVSLGILTTEVDNTLWIYRDVMQMGRVPIDVYQQPLRGLLTFVVPVGIMMAFPVKAFFGILSVEFLVSGLLFGILFFIFSFFFWQYALKQYSSASS